MTGMRSWIGETSAFAAVVMIVQLRSGALASSADAGSRQDSHSPAKASGARSNRLRKNGCRRAPGPRRHS
jgi:hypothetical protein